MLVAAYEQDDRAGAPTVIRSHSDRSGAADNTAVHTGGGRV
jgi:hypothetical protein